MKTQLCLLSGELMPNVIGVLHQHPDRVVPVVTKQSAYQVQHLEAALLAADCSAAVQDPVTVLPYDLADCIQAIGKAASAGGEVTINWTGGTKMMSYAARRVAETTPTGALYVNTADRQVVIEDQPGAGAVQEEMLNSADLGLNTLVHLRAAGHTVQDGRSLAEFRAAHTPAPELQTAAEAVMDAHPREWQDLFRLGDARDKPYTPRYLSPGLVTGLARAKVIQAASVPGAYFLHTETLGRPFHRNSPQDENAKFIKGGYLEVFLWSQLKNRGAFDDVAWHVQLNPGQKGRTAELDAVVASEGRLLTVEAKGRLELSELADLIEEQYARCRRIGRLFGHWVLYVHQYHAEYQSPNAPAVISSQEARARDYGGRLFWRDDLVDLPVLVAGYLNEARPAL